MKTIYYAGILTIILSRGIAFTAELNISGNAQEYITLSTKSSVTKSSSLASTAITGTEKNAGWPVIFEVIRATRNDSLIQYMSRNDRLSGKIAFNALKGAYCYNNVTLQNIPLKSTNEQDLGNLKIKAKGTLEQLIGPVQAGRFVSANEETDFVKESDTAVERVLRKTYRFTRKINGRHILDNTAFARISFSADQELCGFEIVNPEIKPVRNVERLIRTDATLNRLKAYAAEKCTVDKNGPEGLEKIGITVITAEKGFDTYISRKTGDKTLLIPGASFYSDYQLENGEHFKSWSHFCLDADFVPNIDKSLIEGSSR